MKMMTVKNDTVKNDKNDENLFISAQKTDETGFVSEVSVPQEPALNFKVENIFSCPIYIAHKPEWIQPLIKATNPIVKRIKDKYKKDKLPLPNSYHSELLWTYPEFKDIANLILQQSWNILSWQGYDLTAKLPMLTELWVQQFPEEGGYHDIHMHGNNHISGFYFLQCSKKTSHPFFNDPRPGKIMSDLRLKDLKAKVNYANSQIHYPVKPGQFIFFNSYMPHSYIYYKGVEPFRFIHFNMQAVVDSKGNSNVKEAQTRG